MNTEVKTKEVAVKEDVFAIESTGTNLNAFLTKAVDPKLVEGIEFDVADNKEIFANDILIPKIWLTQSMSELRKAKKSDEGDYVDSRTEEILLKTESEEYLPIIVLKTFKRRQTFEVINEGGKIKKKYVSSEIILLENSKTIYKETLEGKELVRREVISAYVLLGRDVRKGLNKPYIVDFSATSKNGGRNLVSDISLLNDADKHSWMVWHQLSKVEESNDDGDYFVKTIKFGGAFDEKSPVLPFLRNACLDIQKLIDSNAIEIDDRDLHDGAKKPDAKVADQVNQASASI